MAIATEHFDVLIVGAGISGVSAAYHLQKNCPEKSYAILEARAEMGGTWDLFRYPGIRSDSDMFTLGFSFRPWREPKAIVDGPSIKQYVVDTAEEYGIDEKIRFNHRVTDLSWSSQTATWTVRADNNGEEKTFTCGMLIACFGYYRYAEGYAPDFDGADAFGGRIIHPQHWPEDLDYTGKRVVIIGSGATAITLAPSMAARAAAVTLLQRSPSYLFSIPAVSPVARFLGRFLPRSFAARLTRWFAIIFQQISFKHARAHPEKMKKFLFDKLRKKLNPDFDIDTHLTPHYDPWDQRVCVVPDDDLYDALNDGAVTMVTNEIDAFVEDGVRLKSGETLKADIIVTATGLILEFLGGAKVSVDGRIIEPASLFTYRGVMFSGVPNLVSVFGYTNASWTLRSDLISAYACRLIEHMDKNNVDVATPTPQDADMTAEPFIDFTSGYVERASKDLPKQSAAPWRHPQDYAHDIMQLRFGGFDDGVLVFSRKAEAVEQATKKAAE
ncbi:MAG: NAD(P)/FAD-dependent oxidoreductase [Pseudomonadota bacterium]